MDYPLYLPWDPRDLLPPGPDRDSDGAQVGWQILNVVFSNILPDAWSELAQYLNI